MLTFCRFQSSTWCQYVSTVLQILTFGSFELHHYHHHADLCTQFYSFWHYVGFSLRRDVNICEQSYISWHSVFLSCILIIIMPIYAHSSTDSDIRQFWVASPSSSTCQPFIISHLASIIDHRPPIIHHLYSSSASASASPSSSNPQPSALSP